MSAHPEEVLAPSALAELRADYESGTSALTALARRFALSPTALRAMARRLNFGARPPLQPFQRRGAAPAEPVATAKVQTARAKKPRPKKSASKPSPAKAARTKPAPPDAAPAAPRPLKPLDLQATAARLRRAAESELVRINDRLEAGADVERHARTLASLVKTLADLARLAEARDAAGAPGADGEGWSLDDLRQTLARRIDALAPDEPAA